MNFSPIIGIEVHVELKTKSKMFCGCDAFHFGVKPNTHTCPTCLGLPGALPVPNKKAIEWCIMIGLALNCHINETSKFDRKNYFYPDLAKGYQISQYDKPFCQSGNININVQNQESKSVRITRVHMEEDTGKLIHDKTDATLIDFNRSGVPLVEIVTEPDISSGDEAVTYLKKIQQIVRYLGVSDCDMEKGSMRCEVNISLHPVNNKSLPKYKVEVKNINSFRFVKKAIEYEIQRQSEILERGELPIQETRGFKESTNGTYSQRTKEEAHDYRYFPEPDIPPIRWVNDEISQLAKQIPELPDKKLKRFMKEYGLSEYDAAILTEEKYTAEYYEKAIKQLNAAETKQLTPKIIANWIINKKADINRVGPEELVKLIQNKTQTVQIDEALLKTTVEKIISDNQKAVDDYKSGKVNVLMFLVGQVMRELKGKGNALEVKTYLENKLK